MIHLKLHFTFSQNIKSLGLKKKLLKKYNQFSPKKCNVIIVCGGDGYMLRTIQQLHKFKKPFFGINCGTVGFLMNDYKNDLLEKQIESSKSIIVNPLVASVISTNKVKSILFAINEISLLRQTKQTSSIRIFKDKKKVINKLVGDGVLLSTPIGSTAYNYSVGGPLLKLNSRKLALTPISVFHPKNWKGEIISDKKNLKFENVNIRRPISLVADNSEIRNVKKVYAKLNKKIKIRLLFKNNQDYKKKLMKLLNTK